MDINQIYLQGIVTEISCLKYSNQRTYLKNFKIKTTTGDPDRFEYHEIFLSKELDDNSLYRYQKIIKKGVILRLLGVLKSYSYIDSLGKRVNLSKVCANFVEEIK